MDGATASGTAVWLVQVFMDHGLVSSLVSQASYLSRDRAVEEAEEVVRGYAARDRDEFGARIGASDCPVHGWKSFDENVWTNGLYYVRVEETKAT